MEGQTQPAESELPTAADEVADAASGQLEGVDEVAVALEHQDSAGCEQDHHGLEAAVHSSDLAASEHIDVVEVGSQTLCRMLQQSKGYCALQKYSQPPNSLLM